MNDSNSEATKERKSLLFRAMCSNYFAKLLNQARELDDGIEQLSETWKLPHLLIRPLGEHTAETNAHNNAVWNVILSTQDGIKEILSDANENNVQDSLSMEQFIQKSKEEYEDLKEQCNALETVLAEYGYHYSQENTLNQTYSSNSDNANHNSSEEVKNVDVEFTPRHNCKCNLTHNASTPRFHSNYLSHTILTPVVNKLALPVEDNSIISREYICTPIRERPDEPIYSKHFYSILKE